jgi:hypothetical protein
MQTMTTEFLVASFGVAAVADVVLRDVDTMPELRPYFNEHSIVGGGALAGLTIAVVLGVTLAFVDASPKANRTRFIIAALMVSLLIDIAFKYGEPLGPSLRPYYRRADAHFWGALAGPFVAVIVFIMQDLYCEYHSSVASRVCGR